MRHIQPRSTYFAVFGVLLLLLAVTVGIAQIHLGWFNLPAAIVIATAKAALIAWYFMELRFAAISVRVYAFAAVSWLVIMFVLTASDYLTRSSSLY